MKHSLAILTLDKWPSVEITGEEFQNIKNAKTSLIIALGIEEKFTLLVENYAEYERTLLDLTLTKMIRQDYEWTSLMDDTQLVNRRIANVLMASQLYIDQATHDISSMFGRKSAAASDLRTAFDRESQQSLGYRVMRELRNQVQHRTLLVGNLSYPSTHHQDGKSGTRFGIQIQLDVDELQNDSRFDRQVRAEIEGQESARDLTAMTRGSLESLSRLHQVVRTLTEARFKACATKSDEVLQTAQREIGHLTGLAAVERDDDGTLREKVYLFPDLAKRVHYMRSRYKELKFSSGWYVSSGLA
jgi:hypothetical protein